VTQFNLEVLHTILTNQWQIDISSTKEIRNSEKIMLEVTSPNGITYILKGEKANAATVENIIQFATSLSSILPVSTYVKTISDTYCIPLNQYVLILEEKLLGSEVNILTDEIINEIGKNLGKLHQFSLNNYIRLNCATSWAMFGGNATDQIGDYDENELSFLNFKKAFQNNPLLNEIEALYNEHRSKLHAMWSELPTAATQGDFCYYNMLFKEDKLIGLYDFFLAGDEVLINECVAVGIYLSWHVDYDGSLTARERFTQFIASYQSERPWTKLEYDAFIPLFAIIRAFRYDRVEDGIAETEHHETFLQDTVQILRNVEVSFIHDTTPL
jgi:homoserine kinase type II